MQVIPPVGAAAAVMGTADEDTVEPAAEVLYRDEIYSLQILLSRTQAGPGRTVKQQQEEISPNHVQRLNLISVYDIKLALKPGK